MAEAETHQMIVRLEKCLHRALTRWAEANDRTIAAQVRTVLRDTVPPEFLQEECE